MSSWLGKKPTFDPRAVLSNLSEDHRKPDGRFPSIPTEIWSEFRSRIQGDVTIVLDIPPLNPPLNPPVSDMHYAGIELIKDTAGHSNTPYPSCVWITDAYNRRTS